MTHPRWKELLVASALVAFAAPGLALAQPSRAEENGDARVRKTRDRQQRQALIQTKIAAYRGKRLKEELLLSPAKSSAISAALAPLDRDYAGLMRKANKARKAVRKAAKADDARALDAAIDRVHKLRRRRSSAEELRFKAIRPHLNTQQAAKALRVLPKIDREVRDHVRQALRRGKLRKPGRPSKLKPRSRLHGERGEMRRRRRQKRKKEKKEKKRRFPAMERVKSGEGF
jgi:hypothetical protein